jgi:putative phage-type endonuclease
MATNPDPIKLWLNDRKTCMTGTMIPAILGISPWMSPFDAWLKFTGRQEEEFQRTPIMLAGNRMQETILKWYEDETGLGLTRADPFHIIRHPKTDLIGATLDSRWRASDYRPVDAKNCRFKGQEWGDQNTDQIPLHYLCQLMIQMAVTDSDFAELAVLFSGFDFQIFIAERDRVFEENIISECLRWWNEHVVKDIPPKLGSSEATKSYLSKMRGIQTAPISPSLKIDRLGQNLKTVKENLARLESDRDEIENEIKYFMGANMIIVGSGWKATWKNDNAGKKVDWKAIEKEIPPDLIAKHTTIKTGSRSFIYTPLDPETGEN